MAAPWVGGALGRWRSESGGALGRAALWVAPYQKLSIYNLSFNRKTLGLLRHITASLFIFLWPRHTKCFISWTPFLEFLSGGSCPDKQHWRNNKLQACSETLPKGDFVASYVKFRYVSDVNCLFVVLSVCRYDYKIAREYNWNVKNKASKGYEENYFFIFRDGDGVYYNELETRSFCVPLEITPLFYCSLAWMQYILIAQWSRICW